MATDPSRRDFLISSIALGAATAAAACRTAQTPQPRAPRFEVGAPTRTGSAAIASSCQFCNACCGIDVSVHAGHVMRIDAFADDPVQAGQLCVKAAMMNEIYSSRHRLERPLKRVGGDKGSAASRFAPVTWDEAFDTIAKKWLALRDGGRAHAIASRTTGRMLRGVDALIGRVFAMLGSPNNMDVGPVCNDAGGNALATTFGLGAFTNGYGRDEALGQDDLAASRFFLFLGTNQAETHPVTFAHLLRGRQKTKAKLVVVDPRHTATAAQADRWLAIRPHTDMALALGMLSHIIEHGLYDKAFVARWVLGFDALRAHLSKHGYTTAWAAKMTDLPEAEIRALAEGYARAKPAAIFCNAGISHQLGAFDTYRALAMLAAITGNIGVPGGGCNFMHNTWPGPLSLPAVKAKLPARRGSLPVGPDRMAHAILAGEPYPLSALITVGNPLLSSANSKRVAEAFRKLDFYVYTGLFMEEAARYADIILPAVSGLETRGVYMRRDDRAVRWQERAVAPVGEAKTDHEIWLGLVRALARNDNKRGAAYWNDAFPAAWQDYATLWDTFCKHTPAMGGMTVARLKARREPLRWPCPSAEHPGAGVLYADHESWRACSRALAPEGKGKRFLTASGKVELYTAGLEKKLAAVGLGALPRYYTHPEAHGGGPTRALGKLVAAPLHPGAVTPHVTLDKAQDAALARAYPLIGLTGRPGVTHFASITHWTSSGKSKAGLRLIQIHPRAARAAKIKNGASMVVESPRGAVRGTALYWAKMREDTIFVPQGYGDAQVVADEQRVPRYAAANALVSDDAFDVVSGQQAYKCFACRVRPA